MLIALATVFLKITHTQHEKNNFNLIIGVGLKPGQCAREENGKGNIWNGLLLVY
ncbi:hypothetical protein GCM10022246_21330 [Pedobacter ginsengiterrae]|uniref:Uncharacterized protein n=1 Tax=Pedobacter ginsengiterrae TaxID=871696 RepID=A0ABP7PN63_9SPHI